MAPLFFRLGIALALILAITAYPTSEHEQDTSDPFSDPLDDGPSLYRAWRASRDTQAVAWTLGEEQVMVQMGMKRRVEAFANWLNPWGEGQITVFVSGPSPIIFRTIADIVLTGQRHGKPDDATPPCRFPQSPPHRCRVPTDRYPRNDHRLPLRTKPSQRDNRHLRLHARHPHSTIRVVAQRDPYRACGPWALFVLAQSSSGAGSWGECCACGG